VKGLKFVLFGLMFILIGGFILADSQSSLGSFGEIVLFLIGIGLGAYGLKKDD
jgi:hypothetical protein